MKKVVLTLSVLTIAVCSYAQSISGGIKAGLNLADLSDKDLPASTDMKLGFHGGVYVNFGVTENFSIQPEVLYNTVGAKMTVDGGGYPDEDYTFKFSYLSVPVMFMYSFGHFNIQAGPQISFLSKAELEWESDGDSETQNWKDFVKGTDIGGALGVGVSFGRFNASARYYQGFVNIADVDDDFGDSFEIKNSAIQISAGVRLFGQ